MPSTLKSGEHLKGDHVEYEKYIISKWGLQRNKTICYQLRNTIDYCVLFLLNVS